MGQSHLPSLEFTCSDRYKEICVSTIPDCKVFRHGYRYKLSRSNYNSSTGKKGPDNKVRSRSSEEVISFNTGIDSTYRETDITTIAVLPAPLQY